MDRPKAPPSRDSGTVGTAGTAVASDKPTAAAEAPPTRLTVEIRPSAAIWVAATADGERVMFRLLQPGERVTVEARNELSFRVGNAGAFVYSLNGVPGKPVGAAGEVTAFRISRDNYQTFQR
jgi:hypothetical protein